MKSTLLLFVLSLWVGSYANAGENWVFRGRAGQQIDDLILNPAPEIQTDPKTGRSLYVLKGIYFRESWDLLIQEKRILTDTAGVFYLRLPISGEVSTYELTALGPHKKKQIEKIEIIIPKGEGPQILQAPEPNKLEEVVESPPAPIKDDRRAELPVPAKKVEPLIRESVHSHPPPVSAPVQAPLPDESRYVKIIRHESSTSTTASIHLGEKGILVKRFFVAPLLALQTGTSGSRQRNYTALVGWTPAYRFNESLSLRSTLGGMVFEKATGGRFLATVAELLGEWNFHSKWSLAAGPGFQHWWDFGGFSPLATGEFSFYSELGLWDAFRLERVSAGGSWLMDNASTFQARLGFTFAF